MRLLVLSDLHHELWKEKAPLIDPSMSHPDVVILAGDINTGAKAIEWAAATFGELPVLYVHGNHESYGKNLEDMQDEIESACSKTSNIHFLNCEEFVFQGVRFLGATMWTDFKLFGDTDRQSAMRAAEASMVDYKRIRLAKERYRKLRAADTAKFHYEHKSWLHRKLAEPYDGKTVVVTHMAPSIKSLSDLYSDDPLSAAYASRLEDLAEKADIWIHGHMHESFDYLIGKCRIVCNPCGYITRSGETENSNFNSNMIVEVKP